MKHQQTLSAAGQSLSEYQLVLRPNLHLEEKILELRRAFSHQFLADNAVSFSVEIMLCRLVQFNMREKQMISMLKKNLSAIAPFLIELKGFGSLPCHTIRLNVLTQQSISSLIRNIRRAQTYLSVRQLYPPWFAQEASILLATKLLPWQYEKGWNEFRHRHFSEKFLADHLVLKKRPFNENTDIRGAGKKFEILDKYDFAVNHPTNEQGKLFT